MSEQGREPYQHLWADCSRCDLPVGKIVCVGRNYAAHARELNNPVPEQPLLFMKPSTALRYVEQGIVVSPAQGEVHYETEIALLIGQSIGAGQDQQAAVSAVAGVGLALDLTLRQLQAQLKQNGHPWERAKAFDGACPVSPFTPVDQCGAWSELEFRLNVNDEPRQHGRSADMLMPIPQLLQHIAQTFTLLPGDIVLTGTPEGVGALQTGDRLQLTGVDGRHWHCQVNPQGV